MKILSVNLGKRKKITWKGKTMITGIYKHPVSRPIFLDTEDVQNDAVCDRKHHGGKEQAVYAYGKQHYAFWKAQYPNLEWHDGMFGENLTINNLDETTIFVGNIYKVGNAIIQVTKPRLPCRVLGIKFNDMQLVKKFWNTTKCGVYFKIVQTGYVKAGDTLKLITERTENPNIATIYKQKKRAKRA